MHISKYYICCIVLLLLMIKMSYAQSVQGTGIIDFDYSKQGAVNEFGGLATENDTISLSLSFKIKDIALVDQIVIKIGNQKDGYEVLSLTEALQNGLLTSPSENIGIYSSPQVDVFVAIPPSLSSQAQWASITLINESDSKQFYFPIQ